LLRRRIVHLLKGPPPLEIAIQRGMKVGVNVSVQSDVVFDMSLAWLIEIGDDVTIAPGAYLLAHDASTKRALGYTRIGRVTVGRGAFVGARALLMPGVTVGERAIVAAGAIVVDDVPEGAIVAGNPARVVGEVDEYLERRRRELADAPRWGAAAGTWPLSAAAREQQRATLADRFGFVE